MLVHSFHREHSAFFDSVLKVVESSLAPKVASWEEKRFFPNEVFHLLGDQGYLGILIPEEFGGVGGDYKLAAAWCEAFGTLCAVGLTTAVNMHSLVISFALARYGTKDAKSLWLPKAVTGRAIGAYAFTEPGAGSDLANLRTKAVKKGSSWIINGSKTFITNGARADFILVLARTDPKAGYRGFTTFLVDTKSSGFKVNRKLEKLGWHSSDTAELTFENVEVPESAILGDVGEGWVQASNSLTWERVMLTLTSLSGARQCIKAGALYASQRKAFGKTLLEIDSIQSMLKEMYRKLVIGEAITYHSVNALMKGEECRAIAAIAKRRVCEDAVWIADRSIQIHGGYGYTSEFPVERWWRDLRLMPIGGGTSEILANIVAKDLGLA